MQEGASGRPGAVEWARSAQDKLDLALEAIKACIQAFASLAAVRSGFTCNLWWVLIAVVVLGGAHICNQPVEQ